MLGVSAITQPSSKLLEVVEDLALIFDTPGQSSSSRPYTATGGAPQGLTAAGNFGSGGGGAIPSIGVTSQGHMVRRLAPGTNQISTFETKFALPLKRDLSLLPVSYRRTHRIVFDTLIRRSFPLIAGVKCEVGVKDDPGTPISTANGGLVLISNSTLNGGAWTLQYYLTNGGALQTGGSSGVVPDGTVQHIRYEYFDILSNPYLNIWINGVLKFTIQGALLPVIDGQEPLSLCLSSGDPVANTIGQIDDNYGNRFSIEQIA